MAFQDFDKIQERVNAERKRKFRKRIIIGTVSLILVVAAIVGGAFAYLAYENKNQEEEQVKSSNKNANHSNNKSPKDGNEKNQSSSPSPKPPVSAAQSVKPGEPGKIIETLCGSTIYKVQCEKTFKNVTVKGSPLASSPKILVTTAIEAVNNDLDKVLEKILAIKTENQDDKDAVEQCKFLVGESKEELVATMTKVNKTEITDFEKIVPDLDSWLSAVMTYQETCVDGFEEGKLKSEVVTSVNTSQVLTSNSLAVIKTFGSLPKAPTRHLLGDVPSWVSNDDRRMLKAVDVNTLKPNATVAKDGSGNFSTINDALTAMPDTMVGDGSQKTIVTGDKSNAKKTRTFLTGLICSCSRRRIHGTVDGIQEHGWTRGTSSCGYTRPI